MNRYLEIFITAFGNYGSYVIREITNPHIKNYFYWLIGISLFFFTLELIKPWRENQPKFRKDFWLDAFYMFFNFFIFSMVGYHALSMVVSTAFNDLLFSFGIENIIALKVDALPVWAQLLTLFVIRDFIQFNVHRILHAVPFLWKFHKVHHSVQQMGFSAHLRYHWMETIVYRTIEYIPLSMIGFGIDEFFIVHIIALSIGHFNHSNFTFPLGVLKYIFNNPEMHIWHHAKKIPVENANGVNFGISLSVWDYLFKTNYIPYSGKNEPLGFDGIETYPESFSSLNSQPFQELNQKND